MLKMGREGEGDKNDKTRMIKMGRVGEVDKYGKR